MKGADRRGLSWALIAAALVLSGGCSLFFMTPVERLSLLIPEPPQTKGYAVGEGGSMIYEQEGLRLVVEPMSDQALNQLFPEESSLGEYSINPYTFGNYVDPEVGYVQNRFTVFRVTVHNLGLAKVELNPLRALLLTDRPGEVLSAYGILAGSAPRNFESYYRSRRGPSGNEYYRFSMRMGIVRSNNYGVDEKIFKGEKYGGFIVFDPLDDQVHKVTLWLRDFVLRFNAFDMPVETLDLRFDFQRQIVERPLPKERDSPEERVVTTTRLRAPSQVSGNATGDTRRDAESVDQMVAQHLEAINACFAGEFLAGRAAEGQLDLRFVIDGQGQVRQVEAIRSTVVSPAVAACVQDQVSRWSFGPSDIPLELLAAEGRSGPEAYLVVATCFLEFADARWQ